MKFERLISRILCLLLIVALLMHVTACAKPPVDSSVLSSSSSQATLSSSSTPSSESTVPSSDPSEPSAPTEPKDPNALEYTLTQADIDEFYRLLDECERMAIAGEDLDAIDAISDQLDDQLEYLYAQNSIAMILYYYDMSITEMEEQHLNCVEICTDAGDAYNQSVRRIYLSDTPAKDMLFEGWTDEDIDMLLKYDERVAQLQQRNSEIEVEYRQASSDDVMIPLYIEFVQNNNEIAKIFGFKNYYEYAYEYVYERDYGSKQVKLMRSYAKELLTGPFETVSTGFNQTFGSLGTSAHNRVVKFLTYEYNYVYPRYVDNYLDVVPENLKLETKNMLKQDSLFSKNADALAGAFTTAIGDRSYCFFGPDYASSTTVIHEAGHYYASRYADLDSIPLDLAEVHSQGNEWLFMVYVGQQMKAAEYEAALNYMLMNSLATILLCLMVDEFEQKVYSSDISDYTAADFDALMDSIVVQYFDLSYVKANLTDVNSYWRAVVVEQPVYYISYAVSAIAAMDLYTVAKTDFDAAAEIYRKLCEEPLEDAGFQESISAVGLSGPFDKDFYSELADLVQQSSEK